MNFSTSSFNEKRFLVVTLFSFIILSGLTAGLNYAVDPAGIYHEDATRYENLVKAKLNSKFGVVLPSSLDDRKYRKATALNFSSKDCVIIGSSHIMQISSFREKKSLNSLCINLINLGVSGGTLEDYIILSSLALKNNLNNNKLKFIFGIDPWSLGFNRDIRWTNFGPEEEAMIHSLLGYKKNIISSAEKSLNLINLQYFYETISELMKRANYRQGLLILDEPVDPERGHEEYVTLPDNSIIYSSEVLNKFSSTPVPVGGENYKSNYIEDPGAIEVFSAHVHGIKEKGHAVYLLMTPYAPNVFKADISETKAQLEHMEPVIRNLGNDLNLPVFGSFNAKTIGCSDNDFYDHMHPKASCLAKIQTN